MRRFRFLGLVTILSFAALALGIVNAEHVATTMRSADDACRAQLTRTLGDDSESSRLQYVNCFRTHGGVGEVGFLVTAS
jgi:hypothetical protein